MSIMNSNLQFDQLDIEIINSLQIDGRASASKIASIVGMSIPSVSDRIKKLQKSGIISGFKAIVNPRKVGLDVQAFITIISDSSIHYNDIVVNSQERTDIINCYATTGNGSHMLFAVTKNSESLELLLRDIQGWPGVIRTETQIILSSNESMGLIEIPKN
tara:strand:+ start:56 stop:535 length:480 start_codon:yes stop_codon:yes gene_type:complete